MTTHDWRDIWLVVFDVDGTLYHQKPLRRKMAVELVKHTALRRETLTLKVLRDYRQMRERLAEAGVSPFEARLERDVAAAHDISQERVRAIVGEWIGRRPLPFLRDVRRSGVDVLFEALRREGRTIAVLSDYPVAAKMKALSLRADIAVAANDAEVMALKPNSKGLREVLRRSGIPAAQALVVGDRDERDGEIARREGTAAMIFDRPAGPTQPPGTVTALAAALGLKPSPR